VPPYCDVREPETAAVARDVADAVDAAFGSDRFPGLLGRDCSIVLGPLLAPETAGPLWAGLY
jgi:hypothetical protein